LKQKFLYAAAVFALMAAGCGRTPDQGATPGGNDAVNPQVKVQQTLPAPQPSAAPAEVAAHLETIAKSVPRVQAARCVVFGNTAIVGIDVDPALERAEVGTVKYSVAEALRKDPYGVNAIVTADIDLNQRLREIYDDIRAGKPISGFANELADIIGRIMPQMPRSLPPANDGTGPAGDDAQHVPENRL